MRAHHLSDDMGLHEPTLPEERAEAEEEKKSVMITIVGLLMLALLICLVGTYVAKRP